MTPVYSLGYSYMVPKGLQRPAHQWRKPSPGSFPSGRVRRRPLVPTAVVSAVRPCLVLKHEGGCRRSCHGIFALLVYLPAVASSTRGHLKLFVVSRRAGIESWWRLPRQHDVCVSPVFQRWPAHRGGEIVGALIIRGELENPMQAQARPRGAMPVSGALLGFGPITQRHESLS